MIIAIGNDHTALELKRELTAHLEKSGHTIINLGTDTSESCNYPQYGEKLALAVTSGKAELGIALCGTGIGISISANKVRGIRAVVCSEPYSARMSRLHNNANVLAMGARVVGTELAKMIVDTWLATSFEGGRHATRVNMISDIEAREL